MYPTRIKPSAQVKGRHCCGTCEYNKRDKGTLEHNAYICMCEESDYYTDYTEYAGLCDCYEEKEENY